MRLPQEILCESLEAESTLAGLVFYAKFQEENDEGLIQTDVDNGRIPVYISYSPTLDNENFKANEGEILAGVMYVEIYSNDARDSALAMQNFITMVYKSNSNGGKFALPDAMPVSVGSRKFWAWTPLSFNPQAQLIGSLWKAENAIEVEFQND